MPFISQIRLTADAVGATVDLEKGGLGQKARRPLHGRSLAIRVLGVVAAAIACLLEGKSALVPPVQSPPEVGLSPGFGTAAGDGMPGTLFAGRADLKHDSGVVRPNIEHVSQRVSSRMDAPPMVLSMTDTQKGGRAAWSLLKTLVDSSIWMSASLASLVPFVQLSTGVAIDLRPFWAGFCESLVVYALDHLRDLKKSSSQEDSSGRVQLLKAMCLLGFVGFFASLAAAPVGRHLAVGLTFGIHLVLCVIYAKVKPRMPYLKAAYVSLCVVFMAVAAPAAYDPSLLASFSSSALLRLVLVILSVSFTIENLQDLRDIKEDREAGVVTIPSGLGVDWTAKFLLLSQFVCVALQCCLSMANLLPLRADMLLIHALCGICAMSFKENTPPYLFQVILEPLYMSPLVMLLVRASFLSG
eukprot:gb/GFBE01034495.1/.p1 GENE.gb/GFBE01034495.1/~~gb/GFBE01034495.1/.p1  ORF type:complete len:413 (+),score=64.75 gb/GFBE01034495.1/:1-1239(+)